MRGRERQVFGLAIVVATLIVSLSILVASGNDRAPADEGDEADGIAPSTATVSCGEEGAQADTGAVHARPDGVRLRVSSRIEGVFHVTAEGGTEMRGRIDAESPMVLTAVLPPGEVLVGCFPRGQIPDDPSQGGYASFTVEDPEGLWTSPALSCEEPVPAGVFEGPAVERNQPPAYDQMARRTVPGIRADDRLSHPGYPETRWPFVRLLVIRGDRAVADLSFMPGGRRWGVDVAACPESGVGDV